MCDYSLQNVKSRPAKLGEKLKTYRFSTYTTGFAPIEDEDAHKTAVCVLPGTELAFASPIRCKQLAWWGGWKAKTFSHMTAIFRQINKENPYTHHDALEFPDGQMVLLHHLLEGQEATVLQLPARPATAAEAKHQQRVPYIG